MFKICVLGCGSVATSGHGPSLQRYAAEHPDVVLAGCCDLNPERAETYRQTFGFTHANMIMRKCSPKNSRMWSH